MNHFIDTAASDLSRARTAGLNQLTPSPFPVLMFGTETQHSFFFAANGTIESFSGAADYTMRITIADAFAGPVGGTWALTIGAGTTQNLRFSVDAAGLQNLLNDDANIASEGGVIVFEQRPGLFLIAHNEVGSATGLTVDAANLFPDCSARLSTLTDGDADHRQLLSLELRRTTPLQDTTWAPISSPYAGWQGVLQLTSSALSQLLRLNGVQRGDFIECNTLIMIEVVDNSGAPACYYQAPVVLRAANRDIEATNVTMTQNFFSKPLVTGLASNVADGTKLGGLSTSNGEYPVGSVVQLMFTDNVVAQFTRLSSTANQSVPWVVRPYDYSVLNPYQWIIKGVQKDGQTCGYDADTDKWHYIVAQGNANAVSVAADQTGFSLPA